MPLKNKNNTQTTSEQLQTNFQKAQITDFFILKMVKMTLSDGQNLGLKFEFRGHLCTFRTENTVKSRPFKAENNA